MECKNMIIYGLYEPKEYIGDEKRILILMREPGDRYNPNDPEANYEWWKDVIADNLNCHSKDDPKVFTYRNKFNKMLECIGSDLQLKNVWYANIMPWNVEPISDGSKQSNICKDYIAGKALEYLIKPEMLNGMVGAKENYNQTATERFKKIIETVKPDYIFTCINIYSMIDKEYSRTQNLTETQGLMFGTYGPKRCGRYSFLSVKETVVFEVYHPSRGAEPSVK